MGSALIYFLQSDPGTSPQDRGRKIKWNIDHITPADSGDLEWEAILGFPG